jgi:hypothetical protein
MSTEAQRAANKKNAQLSTGPRGEPGKARSSQNPRKLGIYSKALLAPDEQAADLARLEKIYLAHYRARTELEVDRVLALAASDWRLRRCRRIEAEILGLHGYERQKSEPGGEEFHYAGAGWGFAHDCHKAQAIQALSRVEAGLFRQFMALKKELAALVRPAPAGEATADGSASPPVEPAPVGQNKCP